MNKKAIFYLLVFILVADLGYSFFQHYAVPFDGDMAGGIVPEEDVRPVLESPLGFKAIKEDIRYPNPNKFFSHWSFYSYFNNAPLFLQNFTNPLNSAYLACAIVKTILQVLLIYMLAFFITGKWRFKLDFLIAAILVVPLFQTNGYGRYMGIIDVSTTYTFFYALPALFLLIYFAPFYLKHYLNKELKGFKYLRFLWIPLALVCSLSGPLNPGIALISSFLILIEKFVIGFQSSNEFKIFDKFKTSISQIPKDYYFYLLPLIFFSLYSLFLGRYNLVDAMNKMSLATMYSRLPLGIYYILTQKIGFLLLFLAIFINLIIIKKRFDTSETRRMLSLFKWMALFSLIYILLLPLGGYRSYRPNIIRYDTLIPITLCLFYVFGKTSFFLIKNLLKSQKNSYLLMIIVILCIFTSADEPQFNQNECERLSIKKIAESPDSIVELDNSCTVLSWGMIRDEKESDIKIKLLKRWKIIEGEKLFYQKESIISN